MNPLHDRAQYRSDLGVSVLRLPMLLAGALLAAGAVAWALQFLFFHGWYLLFLVPMAGAACLAGALYWLVDGAHCRNHWLAGLLGMTTGLAAFLGYFHLCLVQELPPGHALRIDLLPDYIAFRMKTDVARDVGRPDRGNQPEKPTAGLNWYTFVFELAVMVGFPAVAAWRRSRRAYCPELRCWLERETALFPAHSGPSIQTALETETLEDFLAGHPPGGDAQTACRFILEYVQPPTGSPLLYPVYASIEDLPFPRPWYWPSRTRRTSLRQVALTLREAVALRPVFPQLTKLLAAQHAELRDLPVAAATPSASPAVTSEAAVITPVPVAFREQVSGAGFALKVNLLDLIPVAFILGGLGLLFLGGYLVSRDAILASVIPFVAGAAGLVWGVYTGGFCLCVYSNRRLERQLRAAVARRPDWLVDPRDAGAVYVSLIPREKFAKVSLTMSSDLLLMGIDQPRREILLEGDRDRYRIPAGAVASCEPECFFHAVDAQHRNELWMVRLLIRVEAGLRELLLAVGPNDWRPRTNARRRQFAEAACQRIRALRGGRGEQLANSSTRS